MSGLMHYGYSVNSLSCVGLSTAGLQESCREQKPEFIIVTQAHLVSKIDSLGIPLIFDLFAHRLMEAQFEEKTTNTVMELVVALRASCMVLVSNRRQRWSWQGVLSLLGAQHTPPALVVVPLSAQISEPRQAPQELRLIGGGMWWPWQNPWPSLERALDFLDQRDEGEILWYGVGNPQLKHPRLHYMGRVSHHAFRRALLSASAAFDWMEANIEREFAVAFRHMDYLGCGLPVLTGSYSPLQDCIDGGGWIDDDIEAVLEQLLSEPSRLEIASQAAYDCAKNLSVESTTLSLHTWLSSPETIVWRVDNPILHTTTLWERSKQEHAQLEVMNANNQKLKADIEKKNTELEQLRSLVAQQQGSIDRLSTAVSDVVSYRKEALQILGGEIEKNHRTAQEIGAENAILRADITKKTAELEAMDQLRARLENDIQALRVQLEKKRGLWPR